MLCIFFHWEYTFYVFIVRGLLLFSFIWIFLRRHLCSPVIFTAPLMCRDDGKHLYRMRQKHQGWWHSKGWFLTLGKTWLWYSHWVIFSSYWWFQLPTEISSVTDSNFSQEPQILTVKKGRCFKILEWQVVPEQSFTSHKSFPVAKPLLMLSTFPLHLSWPTRC